MGPPLGLAISFSTHDRARFIQPVKRLFPTMTSTLILRKSTHRGPEQRAEEALCEAERALKRWSLGNQKFEDAEALFETAANAYKMTRHCKRRARASVSSETGQEAGDTFVRCADIQNQLENKFEVARHRVAAAQCYKKVDNKGRLARSTRPHSPSRRRLSAHGHHHIRGHR